MHVPVCGVGEVVYSMFSVTCVQEWVSEEPDPAAEPEPGERGAGCGVLRLQQRQDHRQDRQTRPFRGGGGRHGIKFRHTGVAEMISAMWGTVDSALSRTSLGCNNEER